MAESLQKYYSVAQIANLYGFTAKAVREMCHSRGQGFAFKIKNAGRFYIDHKKFREYIERKRRAGV